MSRLLALYPRPWRNRYGEELAELLSDRPATWRDRIDVVKGALDAWLDPQLVAPARPRYPNRVDRLVGLGTIAAGLSLMGWGIGAALLAPRWGSSDPISPHVDTITRVGVLGDLTLAVVLAIAVIRHGAALGTLGVAGAVSLVFGLFGAASGGGVFALLLLLGGTLAFAPAIGAHVTGRMPAACLALGTIVLVAAFLGWAASEGQEVRYFWFLCIYGAAWVTIGIGFLRGSLTPPVNAVLVPAPS